MYTEARNGVGIMPAETLLAENNGMKGTERRKVANKHYCSCKGKNDPEGESEKSGLLLLPTAGQGATCFSLCQRARPLKRAEGVGPP